MLAGEIRTKLKKYLQPDDCILLEILDGEVRHFVGGSEKIPDKTDQKSSDKKNAEVKEEKKSAADRREELLKQLKAVENAIAKKRTKISH